MTIEDIMYICVLEKFVKLGVPMMPRLENVHESQSGNLKKLTEVCCILKFFFFFSNLPLLCLCIHFFHGGSARATRF